MNVTGAEGDLSGNYTYSSDGSYIKNEGDTSYILAKHSNDQWLLGEGSSLYYVPSSYPYYYVRVLQDVSSGRKNLFGLKCSYTLIAFWSFASYAYSLSARCIAPVSTFNIFMVTLWPWNSFSLGAFLLPLGAIATRFAVDVI